MKEQRKRRRRMEVQHEPHGHGRSVQEAGPSGVSTHVTKTEPFSGHYTPGLNPHAQPFSINPPEYPAHPMHQICQEQHATLTPPH